MASTSLLALARQQRAAILAAAGTCTSCVLLGFIHGSIPSSESCWVVPPYEYHQHTECQSLDDNDACSCYDAYDARCANATFAAQWAYGIPDCPPEYAPVRDHDFALLYFLYVSASAASAFGVAAAIKIARDMHQAAAYVGWPFQYYLRTLVAYFVAQLVINATVMITFVEVRCKWHNIHSLSWWLCDRDDGECATSDTISPQAAWAKAFLLFSTAYGGPLTNVLLELVLLCRVHMINGLPGAPSRCVLRFLDGAIVAQLVLFVLMSPFQLLMSRDIAVKGPQAFDRDQDGQSDTGGDPVLQVQVAMAFWGVIHMTVSVMLCNCFLRPLMMERGGDDDAHQLRDATVRRVARATVVAVTSTMLCYFNFGLGLTSWYHFLAIDSVINDACLCVVVLGDVDDDAARAHDAEHRRELPDGFAMIEPPALGTAIEMAARAGVAPEVQPNTAKTRVEQEPRPQLDKVIQKMGKTGDDAKKVDGGLEPGPGGAGNLRA